jgi:hypothetical protein
MAPPLVSSPQFHFGLKRSAFGGELTTTVRGFVVVEAHDLWCITAPNESGAGDPIFSEGAVTVAFPLVPGAIVLAIHYQTSSPSTPAGTCCVRRPLRPSKKARTAAQYRPPITGSIRGNPSRSSTIAFAAQSLGL